MKYDDGQTCTPSQLRLKFLVATQRTPETHKVPEVHLITGTITRLQVFISPAGELLNNIAVAKFLCLETLQRSFRQNTVPWAPGNISKANNYVFDYLLSRDRAECRVHTGNAGYPECMASLLHNAPRRVASRDFNPAIPR